MLENTTPSTELRRYFCAGIGSLQLDVVLVFIRFNLIANTILQLPHRHKKIFLYVHAASEVAKYRFAYNQINWGILSVCFTFFLNMYMYSSF